jgi:hypothetical protein
VLVRDKELGAQVALGHHAGVEHCQRANAGQHQVLGHLVAQRAHVDQQDVCVAYPTHAVRPSAPPMLCRPARQKIWKPELGPHAPQPDLAVVEGDVFCCPGKLSRQNSASISYSPSVA